MELFRKNLDDFQLTEFITKMKAQEDPSDPAEVVRPHLKSMLNGPFSVPRSHEWDSVEDHQPNKVFVYFSACLHYKIVKKYI